MNMHVDPKRLIERPDGSTIPYDKMEPAKQIEHDLVETLCTEAAQHSKILASFKRQAISEMIAKRVMMLEDYGVKKGGKDGNLTLRTADGRFMAKMTVSKHVTFGPELEAAKAQSMNSWKMNWEKVALMPSRKSSPRSSS